MATTYFILREGRDEYKTNGVDPARRYFFYRGQVTQVDNELDADKFRNQPSLFEEVNSQGQTIYTAVADFEGAISNEKSGVAVIMASTTLISVDHGLDGTPTKIWLTPFANVGSFWVSSIDDIRFTIHCETAPEENVNFSWEARL